MLRSPRCFFDGFNDLHVAGAHAQITGQRFANLFFRWIGITLQQGMARHDHSWCAVAALKRVVFDESFLDRVQLSVLRQPFDGRDVTAIRLHGEVKAGFDKFAVEQNGTGAAFTDDAADVSAGKADILAKEVREKQTRLDVFLVQAPVNRNANSLFHEQLK